MSARAPQDFTASFAKARAIPGRYASLIEQMVLSDFPDEEADYRCLVKGAAEQGVMVHQLSPSSFSRSRKQALVLGFAAFGPTELKQGLARLARPRSAFWLHCRSSDDKGCST